MLPLPATSAPGTGSLLMAKACCPRRGEGNPRAQWWRRRPQEVQRETRRLGWLAPPLVAAVLALSPPYLVGTPASVGQAVDVSQKGAALFQKACIGCHDGGGNILQPVSKRVIRFFFLALSCLSNYVYFPLQGATLFTRDLERNGIATEEEIYNITYFGKGRMPGFGEKCTPRGQCTFGPRLQEEEIKQLAEFVKSQADRGWPKLEVYGD